MVSLYTYCFPPPPKTRRGGWWYFFTSKFSPLLSVAARRLRTNCGSERVPRCSFKARKALGPVGSDGIGHTISSEGWRMIHPWKLTWNPKMEFWKMISLFKQVIFRFHVNFPGCTYNIGYVHHCETRCCNLFPNVFLVWFLFAPGGFFLVEQAIHLGVASHPLSTERF